MALRDTKAPKIVVLVSEWRDLRAQLEHARGIAESLLTYLASECGDESALASIEDAGAAPGDGWLPRLREP